MGDGCTRFCNFGGFSEAAFLSVKLKWNEPSNNRGRLVCIGR